MSFRTKFLLFGLLLAGPLAVAAGFALATYSQHVEAAQKRVDALHHGQLVRTLLLSVARHRGLSTTLQSGAEDQTSALVATQAQVERDLRAFVEGFGTPPWTDVAPAQQARMVDELHALFKLPETRSEQRNFQRHTVVTEQLLSTSRRIGGMFGVEPPDAGTYALVYVDLPALVEALGRQRGWGSAVLAAQQFGVEEMDQYLLYAGGVQQSLRSILADEAGLARLDRMLATPADTQPLTHALNDADAFSHRSMRLVGGHEAADVDSAAHFRDGTRAIEAVAAINNRMMGSLEAQAREAMDEARRHRDAAIGFLLATALGLGVVYRAFQRSTVDRLHALEQASQRLAGGDFDAAIHVDGEDEIARLAVALDAMRARMRDAVTERAGLLVAQQADRDKAEFLARWSHDLRTPLNAIVGFSQVIESRAPDRLTPAQRDDLRHIRSSAAHMLNLVNDLLDVSSNEVAQVATRVEPLRLVPVVHDAVQMLHPSAQSAGVELSLHAAEAADAEVWVQGDRTRLLQLYTNVVHNAVKFNRRAGRVDVLVQADAQQVVVSVIDSGIGMSAQQLTRLFTPYERLSAPGLGIPGTGLGLSNAHQFVQAMGGRIEVLSLEGEGSRFDITLPRAAAAASAAPKFPAAPAPPERPVAAGDLHGRIAYVEDEPTNVLVMQALLSAYPGLQLDVYGSGAEALAAADASDQHDLWLLDLNLPDMDGVQLYLRLAARQRATATAPGGEWVPLRAVIVSADSTAPARDQARAVGIDDYWVKPLDGDRLARDLHRLLAVAHPA